MRLLYKVKKQIEQVYSRLWQYFIYAPRRPAGLCWVWLSGFVWREAERDEISTRKGRSIMDDGQELKRVRTASREENEQVGIGLISMQGIGWNEEALLAVLAFTSFFCFLLSQTNILRTSETLSQQNHSNSLCYFHMHGLLDHVLFIKINKIMKDDRLPELEHTLLSINPEKEQNMRTNTEYGNYCKALRSLRDIHEQITSIKTRFDTLTKRYKRPKRNHIAKHEKTQAIHPLKRNKSSTDMLEFKELKSRTVTDLRKEITFNKKFEIEKKLQGAKRSNTMGRLKTHDQIREESMENMRKIETNRRTLFVQKQRKHDQLYYDEKRLKVFMKNMQERKQREKRQFFSMQTKEIYHKIQEKQGELKKIETECNKYENHLKVMVKRKERKLKKIESLRKNLTTITKMTQHSPSHQPPKTRLFNLTLG